MRKKALALVVLLLVIVAIAGALAYRYYWLHRYDALIAKTAPVYRLDPELVRSIVYQESYFNAHAASRAGALGLMQVTEPVVVEWRRERGYARLPAEARKRADSGRRPTKELLADPEINLHIGSWYFAKLLARFGDEAEPTVVALAAYNAGPGNAERWLSEVPKTAKTKSARHAAFVAAIDYAETRRYVVEVVERYEESRE